MADTTPVELLYSGTEVDDGTVPVDDMVDALVGFSGAYEKLAKHEGPPESRHRIRVVGLQKGSAKILIDVVEWVIKNPAAATVFVTLGGVVTAGAYKVITDIAGVINAKKAIQGQPQTINNYTFNDNRVILGDNVSVTPHQWQYLRTGELDYDLDKITRPLEQGRGVKEFQLRSGQQELAKVTSDERRYFVDTENRVTTTRDNVRLEGILNSHSKRSNRGMFHTLSGRHIPYRYVGEELEPLLRAYAYNGVVKVLGKAKFDAEDEPISIEIRDIQLTQDVLF
jgi:hypothetical protein